MGEQTKTRSVVPQTPSEVENDILRGPPIVIPLHADYKKHFIWKTLYYMTCQCCLPFDRSITTYCKYDLPHVPIVGYILLKHFKKWHLFNMCSKSIILFCVHAPAIIQMCAAIVLWLKPIQKIHEEITSEKELILWQWDNLLALLFLLFYFSTHLSDIIVVSKAITRFQDYNDMNKHTLANVTTTLYAFSQTVALILTFYAGLFTIMTEGETAEKFEFAVAVFAVMQLDEWLYKFGVEPMNMIADDLFALYIEEYGTLSQIHARNVYFHFWAIMAFLGSSSVLGIIFFIFY